MKKFFLIQWHSFWYKYHCKASARLSKAQTNSGSSIKDEHFEKFWNHGQILLKLDPELIKRHAAESVKRAFPSE